ncbi:hypothetical protein AGMMS50268_25880 [Spirochaetia bacterium]|nr:hypothetical protein AGMMS50268_25880 [Spirochaetia bacterium]
MNKKFIKALLNVDLVIACTVLAALIFFTFGAVVMRYLINRPITWGEEFQLFCMVLVVFFGAGAGFRLKSHVAIDIVVDRFPKKVQRITEIIIYIFAVIIIGYFFLQSVSFVRQMAQTNRITNILKIPYAITYASFPVSCVLMLINYSIAVFNRLSGKEEEE